MNTKWKDMTVMEKVAFVVSCIAALMVVISLARPEFLPINLTYPAIALITACEAAVYWKKKRKWAVLLIVGAVVSLGCFILECVLQAA